ncbi:MAG TPA: GHMP kinase [Acidobacteriota bacterium]|nr:GHMP kinase [Acidobacteriota bacterium]
MRVVSKAPTRIDLAGGTLDLWPLYLFHENSITINAAINLFAEVTLERLEGSEVHIISKDQKQELRAKNWQELDPDGALPLHVRLIRYFAPEQGFKMETESRAPAGSGLGGSSTLAIAICGALNEISETHRDQHDFIGICRDIEAQVLGIPTGVQDHYAALYGGLNGWSFHPNEVKRLSYSVPIEELQNRLLLFYSGLPRNSGINNWQVFKQQVDGDRQVREQLGAIRTEALSLHEALEKNSWEAVFQSISREWEARKKLAPSITTPEIQSLIQFGFERGAKAAKVCGAGGGGCVFLMMDPDVRMKLAEEAKADGYRLLEFSLVPEGLTIQS